MRARALILLAGVAGCDSILRLDPITPLPQATSYRKSITITNRTGMLLADQPVSIALASDPDLFGHALHDGSDVAFSDGANTLPFELVAYSGGSLDAWVRVPSLAPGETTIYLTYGGGAVVNDPAAAWPDAYVGVWHQTSTGAISIDSTKHGHDLSARSAAMPTPVAGIAGSALAYDAAKDEYLCSADGDGSLELATSFTYSVWVEIDQPGGQFDMPLHKGGSDPSTPGFELQCPDGTWTANIADGTQSALAYPSTSQIRGRWVEVVIEVDRGGADVRGYLDGAQTTDQPIPSGFGSLASGEPFCLGAEGNGNYPFLGSIDEARVVATLLPSAQIQFEHANLATRDQVIAVGAEEAITP